MSNEGHPSNPQQEETYFSGGKEGSAGFQECVMRDRRHTVGSKPPRPGREEVLRVPPTGGKPRTPPSRPSQPPSRSPSRTPAANPQVLRNRSATVSGSSAVSAKPKNKAKTLDRTEIARARPIDGGHVPNSPGAPKPPRPPPPQVKKPTTTKQTGDQPPRPKPPRPQPPSSRPLSQPLNTPPLVKRPPVPADRSSVEISSNDAADTDVSKPATPVARPDVDDVDADGTVEPPVPMPRSRTAGSEPLSPAAVKEETPTAADVSDQPITPTSESLQPTAVVEKEAQAAADMSAQTTTSPTTLKPQSPPTLVPASPDIASLPEPVPAPSSATSDDGSTANAAPDTISPPVPKPRSIARPLPPAVVEKEAPAVDTTDQTATLTSEPTAVVEKETPATADMSDQGSTTTKPQSPTVVVSGSLNVAPLTEETSATNDDSPATDTTLEASAPNAGVSPPRADDIPSCDAAPDSPSPKADISPTTAAPDIPPPSDAVLVIEPENDGGPSSQNTSKEKDVAIDIEKVLPRPEQPLLSQPAQPHTPTQKQAKKPCRPPPPVHRPQGKVHTKEAVPEALDQTKGAKTLRPAQPLVKPSPLPEAKRGNISRLSPHASPQPSPRASPQGSPRASPRASPRGSPQPSPRASPRASPAPMQAGELEGGVHVLKYSDRKSQEPSLKPSAGTIPPRSASAGHSPKASPRATSANESSVSSGVGGEEYRPVARGRGLGGLSLQPVSKEIEVIRQTCKKHQQPFTDPDFPPTDRSLYLDPGQPCSKWGVYQWLRPSQIRDPNAAPGVKWTVFWKPGPKDILQGALDNCWALSSLAIVAEQPTLLEEILITRTYSREGAYQVRLCKDGNWQTIIVDDCFPCSQFNEMVFSKASRKQLWVPLIEKGLAKLYGSYQALGIGRILSGLSALTGLPCEKIFLQKMHPSQGDVDHDLVWAKLLSFRESSWPMGAMSGNPALQQEDYIKVGLLLEHAYSILDVRCLEGSLKLIRLRNPWGKFSWKGKWSDHDPVWKSNPGLRKELQARGGEEGIFWISFEHFMHYFGEVDVCRYRAHWHSTRLPATLPNFAPSRYSLLTFTVSSTAEVEVSLYQPSTRRDDISRANLVDLAILVLRYKVEQGRASPVSCILVGGSEVETTVTCSGFLEAGSYAVLPLAFNHWDLAAKKPSVMADGTATPDSKPCVVALHSSKEIQCHENVETGPGFLVDSIFLLPGKKSVACPGIYLVQMTLQSCHILVAVNESTHLYFTVTCDATGSNNMFSTRGALCTTDSIPPRHRQVLAVATQMQSTKFYQLTVRLQFQTSQQNPAGALHRPQLLPANQQLHSPRPISS